MFLVSLKKVSGFFVLILLLIGSVFPVIAYTNNEESRLQNGEVVSKSLSDQLKGDLKGVEGKVFIDAPKEVVWGLLEDHANLMKVIPKINKVKVLEKTENYQKVQAAIKVSSFLPSLKYVILLDQRDKYNKMKFTKVGGCFKELYGAWELEPMGNGTVLTYRMFVDPGFMIPSSACSSSLKGVLPEILNKIKVAAETQKGMQMSFCTF